MRPFNRSTRQLRLTAKGEAFNVRAAVALRARLWLSEPEALLDLALQHAGIAQVGLHHAMPFLRAGRLKAVLTELHDPGEREIVLHDPHWQYLAPRVRLTVDALLAGLAEHPDLQARRDGLPAEFVA